MAETAMMTTYVGKKRKKKKTQKRKFRKATSHARDYTVKSPASY